ncbi:14204_t:CDS:1, partial [Ambispora leptoticha]
FEQEVKEDKSYIFINSLSPITRSQVQVNSTHASPQPFFKLPFPPAFSIKDLISNSKSRKSKSKQLPAPPNAFIIYRRAFVKAAREEGHQLPMTVISSMASKSWALESVEVKKEYKRVAKEARKEHRAQTYNKFQALRNRDGGECDNEAVKGDEDASMRNPPYEVDAKKKNSEEAIVEEGVKSLADDDFMSLTNAILESEKQIEQANFSLASTYLNNDNNVGVLDDFYTNNNDNVNLNNTTTSISLNYQIADPNYFDFYEQLLFPTDQSSIVLDFDQDNFNSDNTIAQSTNINDITTEALNDEHSKEMSNNTDIYCTIFGPDLYNFCE